MYGPADAIAAVSMFKMEGERITKHYDGLFYFRLQCTIASFSSFGNAEQHNHTYVINHVDICDVLQQQT
jgi:hypothetical protein